MKIFNRGMTFYELLVKTRNLALGFLYSIRFDECKRIQVVGRIKIKKNNGYIKVGRCLIWPGVVMNIKGKG